jgi:hypothetical protein
MVFYEYTSNGKVIGSPISYTEVLVKTGLKDQVGLTELGWTEYFPPQEPIVITKEQLNNGMRGMRGSLLEQSDWTQMADTSLSVAKKAEWAQYRQALRDMPETFKDATQIEEIVLPTKPA